MSKLSSDELKQKENQVGYLLVVHCKEHLTVLIAQRAKLSRDLLQVPEEEYFVEGEVQSQLFDVNNGNGGTEEDAAAREEKLAQEKEEGLKAEKEKREEAMKRIEAKEAERKKEEEGK